MRAFTTFTLLALTCSCTQTSILPVRAAKASAQPTAPSTAQSSLPTDPVVIHGLNHEQDLQDARDWLQLKYQTELAGGIEPASAGIHVLYTTVNDPDIAHPSFPSLQEDAVRNWRFWRGKPYYHASYTAGDELTGDISLNPSCHIGRATVNAVFQYGLQVDSVSGLYSVTALADASSLAILRALQRDRKSNLSTGGYIDWYGIERAAGSEPTPLRLIVASNDLLYRPIEISSALEDVDVQGLSLYTFIIADELDQSSALSLKALLEM